MCRIAAYRGPSISLSRFLTAPDHSLSRQSWAAREMRTATVNADGFGFGWLDANGQPATYRSKAPIWSDANIDALGRSLSSPLWMGNVRSSTDGQDLGIANTQPFTTDGLMYVHNGYVKQFADAARRLIRQEMTAGTEARIRGTTDSEHLFATLFQYVEAGDTPADAFRRLFDWLAAKLPDTECLLTMALAQGEQVVAVRHSQNGISPTLYLHSNWSGGVVVASEAFDDDDRWQAVDDHQLIIIDDGIEVENL